MLIPGFCDFSLPPFYFGFAIVLSGPVVIRVRLVCLSLKATGSFRCNHKTQLLWHDKDLAHLEGLICIAFSPSTWRLHGSKIFSSGMIYNRETNKHIFVTWWSESMTNIRHILIEVKLRYFLWFFKAIKQWKEIISMSFLRSSLTPPPLSILSGSRKFLIVLTWWDGGYILYDTFRFPMRFNSYNGRRIYILVYQN